jgi:hypothetical protein
VSKLDFAIIVTLAAGCLVWIERGQVVIIDAQTQSELAAAAAAIACPGNDSMPYSANCILFMSGTNWQVNSGEGTVTESQAGRTTEVSSHIHSSACPDRDTVPYTASCLAYLQGATTSGMRWRVTAPTMSAPLSSPPPVAAAMGGSRRD